MKLSKARLSEIIQPGGFPGIALSNIMGNLTKKAVLDLAVPLAKGVLPKLATKATSSVLVEFERKISKQGAVREGKNSPYSFQMKT